jgi:hypothetical protein
LRAKGRIGISLQTPSSVSAARHVVQYAGVPRCQVRLISSALITIQSVLTFRRYANDASLNRELKEVSRWNDPAANFLTVSPNPLSRMISALSNCICLASHP